MLSSILDVLEFLDTMSILHRMQGDDKNDKNDLDLLRSFLNCKLEIYKFASGRSKWE